MILLVLLLCASVATAAPINLVDNPGFEAGMASWTSSFAQAPTIDTTAAHSGSSSAKVAVEAGTVALDSVRLGIGRDIDPHGTYEVSAWIRNGGLEKGIFGGRVYFHAADDEYVQMYTFGQESPDSTAHDWRQAKMTIGPDGDHPIPGGAAEMFVRFSVWNQEQDCTGTVWVDDVQIVALDEPEVGSPPDWLQMSDAGTAVILKDDFPAGPGASSPDAIAQMLRDAGMSVNVIDSERFSSEELLNPRWVDLVVLPYGEYFPADARDAFVSYAQSSGSFMTLGGLPFGKLVRKADDEWIDVSSVAADPDTTEMLADFEGEPVEWDFSHVAHDDAITAERVQPGADGTDRAARITLLEGFAWAYAGLEHIAPPYSDAVLCFWARGDEETESLAIELRGEDGSRWKQVVSLGQQWKWYEVAVRDLLSYATEGRGGPGDYLRSENIAGMWFGATQGMVGSGGHDFWLDGIQWRQQAAATGTAVLPMRPSPKTNLTEAAFGTHTSQPFAAANILQIFVPEQEFSDVSSLQFAAPPADEEATITGNFSGYVTTAPIRGEGTEGLNLGGPRIGRLIPVVRAEDDGNDLAAGSIYLQAGRARSGVRAMFGIDNVDLVEQAPEAMQQVIKRVAAMSTGSLALQSVQMEFATEDGQPTTNVRAEVWGELSGGRDLSLDVSAYTGGKPVCSGTTDLSTRQATVALPDFDPTLRQYRVDVELKDGETVLDRETIEVNARRCFLSLCDWLVETQAPDGTFSGTSFQDNRAARGLLGAYEITGDEKYRDAAIQWGLHMIDRQREDGGYRMGYGITSEGEACYVADGGEIAIAMARLVSYTGGETRQKFIDSLHAYFDYRESFRLEDGGIAVGWVFHKRFSQEGGDERVDVPFRSDKAFGFVIGCSLAATSAYAEITDRPEDHETAVKDTRRLLEDYSGYSGAGAESAMWAHHYIADEQLQEAIEEDLQTGFLDRVTQPNNRGWLGGGGRAVLDLDIITWWLEEVDQDPAMQAAFGRWLNALCWDGSTSAIRILTARGDLNNTQKRFLCFAATAMADVVDPMITLKPFEQ